MAAELNIQGLQAAYFGEEDAAYEYFMRASDLLSHVDNLDIKINVIINRCLSILRREKSLEQIRLWKEISNLISQAIIALDQCEHPTDNTLEKSSNILQNDLGQRAIISFLSGLSSLYLEKFETARDSFVNGKSLAMNKKNHLIIPHVGSLSNPTVWDDWLEKSINSIASKAGVQRRKKKDWTLIEKELDKELEKDEEDSSKLGGDSSFRRVLQKIYQGADEDTRRAMNKSYQTSAGTVLSTNWSEVSGVNYETNSKLPNID